VGDRNLGILLRNDDGKIGETLRDVVEAIMTSFLADVLAVFGVNLAATAP
jgi:hypothetical protein